MRSQRDGVMQARIGIGLGLLVVGGAGAFEFGHQGADAPDVGAVGAQRGEVGGRAFQYAAEFQDVVAQRGMVGHQLPPWRSNAGAQLVGGIDAGAAPAMQQAARGQALDGFAHGVARHRVLPGQHALGRQPRARRPGAVQQRGFHLTHHRLHAPAGAPAPLCRHRHAVCPRPTIAPPTGPTNLNSRAEAGIMRPNVRRQAAQPQHIRSET
ncbi:hypothetical protein D9M72_437900 [compost metagenome]